MSLSVTGLVFVILLLSGGALLAYRFQKLTGPAAITGFFTGVVIYAGSEWAGIAMLAVFFATGIIATRWRSSEKTSLGFVEKDHERRGASQVLANSGLAALIALGCMINPATQFPGELLIACCFSSAAADTVSSELGTIYGKRFYNILSFRRDSKGLDGVVSLEGTLAGIAGSILLALVFCIFYPSVAGMLVIVIAGTIGNFTDSVLGAALERKGMIKNDTVNFLNTVVAALAGWLLWLMF